MEGFSTMGSETYGMDISESTSAEHDGAESAGLAFVDAFANVMTHIASGSTRNGDSPFNGRRYTRFHAVRAPQLTILDYLHRIANFFACSHECFVFALIYVDRIVKIHPDFTICKLSVHRLLVTSVMLAAKFFDDVYYSNAYYAKVGGVHVSELNALEALFLKLIDFRLHVLPAEFEQYRTHVLSAAQGNGPYSGPGPIEVPEAPEEGLPPPAPRANSPVGTSDPTLSSSAGDRNETVPYALHPSADPWSQQQ